MAGIYGVFLKDRKTKKGLDFTVQDSLKDKFITDNGIVGRSVLNKLKTDRFFETQKNITICFEGVNLSDKIKNPNQFFEEYSKKGISFINELKGSYSGFIYDLEQNKVFVFNDHLSTKNIFYFFDKNLGFIFSSELIALKTFFKNNSISFSLNQDAVYMMALYGFILEDNTYINEVKKLPYSSLITFDLASNEFKIDKLFSYSTRKESINYADSLDRINVLMEDSVEKNWSKDINFSSKHLSLLSGGMDARTNIIIAKDLGFENISTITFGQSDSKDILYAKEIAIKEGLNSYQRFLDTPSYLIDNIIENYILPNDGLMMFQTSAHTSSTVKSFNLKDFQVLHTGQIGDLLFGSFTKEHYDFKKNRSSIGYTGFVSNDTLLNKIESLPNILDKYQERGLELYTYEQRVINATLVGDRSLNGIIDNISPFFDLELINFCLSLPNKYKASQMIYFDWLKKYHSRALSYPWDKIEMLPNNKYKIIYGKKFKKYFNGAKKYFNLKYDSMNPYNEWLKKDITIIRTLDAIFEAEILRDYISNEVKEDLREIYQANIFEFRNKFAVITALLAMNLYFNNGE